MATDPEEEFRRQLRRTPGSPVSPTGLYVAAVALAGFGALTTAIALSSAMRWSGLIIMLLAVGLAIRTRWADRRRR